MAFWNLLKETGTSLIADLIALGIFKRGGTGKILTQEQAEAVVGKFRPHILGVGKADEALFATELAKLEDRCAIKISRFLSKLEKRDRESFILVISTIPEAEDRANVLNMFAQLPPDDMELVAKGARLLYDGEPILQRVYGKIATADNALAQKIQDLANKINTNYQGRP